MHTERDITAIHNPELHARLQHLIDHKTKPLGALGQIETLALRLGLILGTDAPFLQQGQVMVFAGDHGLARQGVSAYPSEVTAQMVENFLSGGAAVSVLAAQHGLDLSIVNMGVARELTPHPHLINARVAPGTADASQGPAMTLAQCEAAVAAGIRVVRERPGNAVLLGEMGIGNTSSAALLMARLTGQPLSACVGRGTGLDDAALVRKQAVLAQALAQNAQASSPWSALAALGGFEIAGMVGAICQAALERRVIVVDGFIASVAVLVASKMAPTVLERCIFAHVSAERGHQVLLDILGAQPLLNLGLRLGEGSGAALAWPLLVSACHLLRDMASFEQAGVSTARTQVIVEGMRR